MNLQNYEHVLSKLLSKNKKQRTGRKEEELGGSHDETTRARSYEGGEGDIDSDISEARDAAGIWRRKEKARFHSLLNVVDWEGVEVEKRLEQEDEDWDWDEWEGRRKSLFDPKR